MQKIYLHTGTNMGDRKANLLEVNQLIEESIGKIIKASSIYETSAWGEEDQAGFLNQALEVHTLLNPKETLKVIHIIETEMGRIREKKWGQRLIDIDIIFYGNEIINTPSLIIPHKHMHQRNFVLVPMQEIAAEFMHPVLKKNIQELLLSSEDGLSVKLWN